MVFIYLFILKKYGDFAELEGITIILGKRHSSMRISTSLISFLTFFNIFFFLVLLKRRKYTKISIGIKTNCDFFFSFNSNEIVSCWTNFDEKIDFIALINFILFCYIEKSYTKFSLQIKKMCFFKKKLIKKWLVDSNRYFTSRVHVFQI